MLRYSLFTLLVAVLGVALFCAALANATEPWKDGTKLGLWFFLLTSLIAAIASRERKRAIASGMVVFGFGFFFFLEDRRRPDFVETAVDWAFVTIYGPPPGPVDEEGRAYPATTIQQFMRQPRPGNGILDDVSYETDTSHEVRKLYATHKECFSQIAYVGLTVLLSFLGGGLGLMFYARSRPPPLEMS